MYVHIHMYTYVHVHIYICICVYIHTYAYICTCAYIHTCIYIYTHTYIHTMYIHMSIHTGMHAYMQKTVHVRVSACGPNHKPDRKRTSTHLKPCPAHPSVWTRSSRPEQSADHDPRELVQPWISQSSTGGFHRRLLCRPVLKDFMLRYSSNNSNIRMTVMFPTYSCEQSSFAKDPRTGDSKVDV